MNFTVFPRWRPACCLLVLARFTFCWGATVDPAKNSAERIHISMAVISYSYSDPSSDSSRMSSKVQGVYGLESNVETEQGKIVHVQSEDGGNHACTPITNVPESGRWIALIQRGGCKFHTKMQTGLMHNASAIIVYDNRESEERISMRHNVNHMVNIFIHKSDGERLVELVDHGVLVNANITLRTRLSGWLNQSSAVEFTEAKNQTMLVTLLTFIGLLVFGLSALLAYAVRRSQHVHKNRPRIVFALPSEGTQARAALLPPSSRIDMVRPPGRVRPSSPPPSWNPSWMPATHLSTIQEASLQSIPSADSTVNSTRSIPSVHASIPSVNSMKSIPSIKSAVENL